MKNLKGYKTYIIAFAMLCWAVGGFICGKVEFTIAMQSGLIALTMMGVRHGIPTQS